VSRGCQSTRYGHHHLGPDGSADISERHSDEESEIAVVLDQVDDERLEMLHRLLGRNFSAAEDVSGEATPFGT